ncbi:MAG TPA: DUF4157 domain-containing protein [Crinalium sp.]|jgi:hypothetical protein
MAFRTRYRRKAPSSPDVQGLFFDKAHSAPAFFNPSRQTGERGSSASLPVVQRQEGATPAKADEDKPMQKQAKKEEEPPVQKQSKPEDEKPAQKQAKEEEKPVQKQAKQEEEPPAQKQAKSEEEKPVQKQVKPEEEKPVQKQAKQEEEPPVQKQATPKEKKHLKSRATAHTSHAEGEQEQIKGLPDRLKAGIEALSGVAMDEVKVHYNSSKPAAMNALAYTQGTDIYLAPGQEQHLPHEVWHVVQQKQGRVEPTLQTKGIGVNDDPGLEREATVMGQKANNQSAVT